MTKMYQNSVTVVVDSAHAFFTFQDGAVVEAAPEVLSRSALLYQTLSSTEDTSASFHLDTSTGFLRTWLQWTRQETDPSSCDAQQLVEYLLAADFMIDEEAINTLCRRVARCLLGPERPTEDDLKVLETLPSNLMPLVLGATPKTLLSLLPLLPTHLHMEALHAVHPTIASNATMRLVHRDTASKIDSVLWALLPKVAGLQHFCLEGASVDVGFRHLAPHLAKLSAITHLSLKECEAQPDDFEALGFALGSLTGLKHLCLAGMHPAESGTQALAPHLVHLRSLTHLDVSQNPLDVDAARALAESLPALTCLRELILQESHMLEDAFEAIVRDLGTLSSLELLNVQNCAISFLGMYMLDTQLRRLTRLKSLQLLGTNCGGFDTLYLGHCLQILTDVQHLDLRGVPINATGIRAMLQPLSDPHPLRQVLFATRSWQGEGEAVQELVEHLPKFIHLEHLSVTFDKLTTEGSKLLGPCLEKLTALTNLYLGSSAIRFEVPEVLVQHITQVPCLKSLTLCNFAHKAGYVVELAQCFSKMTCLLHLDLRDRMLPSLDDVMAFVPLLDTLTCLQHLNLCNTNIGVQEANLIADHITVLSKLSHLDLHKNPLGFHGMHTLAPALCELTSLAMLDMSSCGINGEEGAEHLASCFPSLNSLTFLDVTGNSLADEGATLLSQHLSHLSCLEELFLTENSISIAGVKALVPQAEQLTSLTWLDLRGNDVDDDYVSENAPHLCLKFVHYESSIVIF